MQNNDENKATVRFPAEWEEHLGTMLTWPWNAEIWGEFHAEALACLTQMAAELSAHEQVHISVPDGHWRNQAARAIEAAGGRVDRVFFYILGSNDVWARDHGPTWIYVDGERHAVCWKFNAWGGKFAHEFDAVLAPSLLAAIGDTAHHSEFFMEGGAIETDGRGTLLCTDSVALVPTRNPGVTRESIEREFHDKLGTERVVWFEEGMECDDTDGHIDTLVRFVSPDCLVYNAPAANHPDREVFQAIAKRVESWVAEKSGRSAVALPAPVLFHRTSGERLPATYANFYIANGVVLLPTYGIAELDEEAAKILQKLFPDRKIVNILSIGLISQGGAIHCATQQIPARLSP